MIQEKLWSSFALAASLQSQRTLVIIHSDGNSYSAAKEPIVN